MLIVSSRLVLLLNLLPFPPPLLPVDFSPRLLRVAPTSSGSALSSSSTIVTWAARAVRESGLRSIDMTVFPISTSAWQRSPSSRGTNTTSAVPMPARQHFPRSEESPGIWKSGLAPSATTPSAAIKSTKPLTRSGVRWNKLTSTCAGMAAASSAILSAASATTLPLTEITGRSALTSNFAAAAIARRAGAVVRSPSR